MKMGERPPTEAALPLGVIVLQCRKARLERRYSRAKLGGAQFIFKTRFVMWRELRDKLAVVGFSYQVINVAIWTGQGCLPGCPIR
jgi:hypothetical protein